MMIGIAAQDPMERDTPTLPSAAGRSGKRAVGAPSLLVRFASLLQAIYWILDRLDDDDPEVRALRCQECGCLLVQTDRRLRFCPSREPSEGSTCGSAHGMRKAHGREKETLGQHLTIGLDGAEKRPRHSLD
jgi:hypothetical protein